MCFPYAIACAIALTITLLNGTLEDAQELYEEMQHRYELRVEW